MTKETDPEVARVASELMRIFETFPDGPDRQRALRELLVPFLGIENEDWYSPMDSSDD